MTAPCPSELRDWFGDIDIYLFDQLLKGRITPDMAVLDAGCGSGRNLIYLLRCGCEVYGVDSSASDIAELRRLAATLSPDVHPENFRVEDVASMSFGGESFDAVICSAVLHLAADEATFRAMLGEMWRVLKPGGIFFSRLASTIGIENRVRCLEGRRYRLPDGTDRFLVDERMLLATADSLGAEMLEPIKTTNVQNQRCMTTWCLRKQADTQRGVKALPDDGSGRALQ